MKEDVTPSFIRDLTGRLPDGGFPHERHVVDPPSSHNCRRRDLHLS